MDRGGRLRRWPPLCRPFYPLSTATVRPPDLFDGKPVHLPSASRLHRQVAGGHAARRELPVPRAGTDADRSPHVTDSDCEDRMKSHWLDRVTSGIAPAWTLRRQRARAAMDLP